MGGGGTELQKSKHAYSDRDVVGGGHSCVLGPHNNINYCHVTRLDWNAAACEAICSLAGLPLIALRTLANTLKIIVIIIIKVVRAWRKREKRFS